MSGSGDYLLGRAAGRLAMNGCFFVGLAGAVSSTALLLMNVKTYGVPGALGPSILLGGSFVQCSEQGYWQTALGAPERARLLGLSSPRCLC